MACDIEMPVRRSTNAAAWAKGMSSGPAGVIQRREKECLVLYDRSADRTRVLLSASGTSPGLSKLGSLVRHITVPTQGKNSLSKTILPASRPVGKSPSASPRKLFVPDFVTMFSAGPAVQPNSAENEFVRTVISCIGRSGRSRSRLPAPAFIVARTIEERVVSRRPPTPVTT